MKWAEKRYYTTKHRGSRPDAFDRRNRRRNRVSVERNCRLHNRTEHFILKHHGLRPSSDRLIAHVDNAKAFIEDVCHGCVFLELSLLITYIEKGSATVTQRLPTAVQGTGMMLLRFMSLACGLILDTVTKGHIEMKRLHSLGLRPTGPASLHRGLCWGTRNPSQTSTAPLRIAAF